MTVIIKNLEANSTYVSKQDRSSLYTKCSNNKHKRLPAFRTFSSLSTSARSFSSSPAAPARQKLLQKPPGTTHRVYSTLCTEENVRYSFTR